MNDVVETRRSTHELTERPATHAYDGEWGDQQAHRVRFWEEEDQAP